MPRKYRAKRGSSRDPLEIQISVRMRLPKGTAPSQSLAHEFIQYRIDNGEDHPRATTKIVRWKNPSRKGTAGNWRQGNQSDAWATLGKFLSDRNTRLTIRAR
jgi:hypothetical protein